MTDASSKIDSRRLKVGNHIGTLCITKSSIPCSRSVMVSFPVTRQRRHREKIQHGCRKLSTRQFPRNVLRKPPVARRYANE